MYINANGFKIIEDKDKVLLNNEIYYAIKCYVITTNDKCNDCEFKECTHNNDFYCIDTILKKEFKTEIDLGLGMTINFNEYTNNEMINNFKKMYPLAEYYINNKKI